MAVVQLIASILNLALLLYVFLLLARLIIDWIPFFNREWRPKGAGLVAAEIVYTLTDPPIKLFRRFIPPLRLGGASLDLSVIFVLLVCYVLSFVNRQYILVG